MINKNFERIRSDLISRGLTYDRLLEDLLDHVCCMLEEEMERGDDFEASYRRVLGSIPDHQLSLIQHQTLLNLDKKYQRMKKITYVFGLISVLVMVLGAIFRNVHWPGAGILFSVGVLMTVFGFLPLYFRSSYLEMKEKRSAVTYVLGYLTLSLILMGALFKSQHLPGAGIMLTVGVVTTVFGFLPIYFRRSYRELEGEKDPVFGIVGYITLALLLTGALFKIMHWPGAGVIIYASLGFLVVGFVPLYVANIFQKTGREKVLLPYLIMVVVGISLVMLIGNTRMSREALDLYLAEAVSDEIQTEQIRERTAMLVEEAGDTLPSNLRSDMMKIHSVSEELLGLMAEMQEDLKAYVGQPGVETVGITELENTRAGREVVADSGLGWEFVESSRDFRKMLAEIIRDPVIMSQIDDHLHLIRPAGSLEYNGADVTDSPMIRVYFMNGSAAKGIALSEYVAINYLLDQ
ncbi:MAG: GldL-related protein [Bacteroidales bacterium]